MRLGSRFYTLAPFIPGQFALYMRYGMCGASIDHCHQDDIHRIIMVTRRLFLEL